MQGIASGFNNEGSTKPQNLFAGEFPHVSRIVTVTGSEAYPVGSVLGEITADRKFTISVSDAGDGSEIPDAILGEELDLSGGGEAQAVIYLTGEFNESALNFGPGHNIDSVRSAFRTKSIFLRTNQAT